MKYHANAPKGGNQSTGMRGRNNGNKAAAVKRKG
nr:MAG TPA: hypothetical protein [Caudoviricetes sp.]